MSADFGTCADRDVYAGHRQILADSLSSLWMMVDVQAGGDSCREMEGDLRGFKLFFRRWR